MNQAEAAPYYLMLISLSQRDLLVAFGNLPPRTAQSSISTEVTEGAQHRTAVRLDRDGLSSTPSTADPAVSSALMALCQASNEVAFPSVLKIIHIFNQKIILKV